MVKAGEIFDMVRAMMNDTDGAVYSNAKIIPYFKIAYDELKLDLEDYSIPIGILSSAPITVTAGITEIGGHSGPTLPAHLIEVLEIYERTTGSSMDYVKMTRQITLPKTSIQTSFLEVWTWQDQRVKLLGATSNVDVVFDYIGELVDINNENSIVDLTNARLVLAARTSAVLATFIEESQDRYQSAMDTYTNAVDKMLNIKVKPQQRIPIRRLPFNSRNKARGWIS